MGNTTHRNGKITHRNGKITYRNGKITHINGPTATYQSGQPDLEAGSDGFIAVNEGHKLFIE